MKLKYMIRGLGLGVVMTAVVMGAYSRQAVADARVAVLKEYGLGADSVLMDESETSGEAEDIESTEEASQPTIIRNEEIESEINSVIEAAKDNEQSAASDEIQPQTNTIAGNEESVTQPAEVPDGDNAVTGDVVQITISRGDDSGTISRKLHNAGLIENADEYDAYLMQHGYDKKLSTGTKDINVTDSWQEIAEKLTRK